MISLLLVTTAATMFVADSSPPLGVLLATLVGGYLAAGGAGAINHYIERDIDARMSRTSRRPLPSGRIEPRAALWFGIALGALSFTLFAVAVNMPAALLAMAGLLGYVFVYTLWLKPRTTQNIVIGGAAGAVPPLVGWAAVSGGLDPSAFYLFAIVFYWTPPHFWALALLIKDEYARTGIPMLPVVDGEAETRRQILLYGWLLLAITALPVAGGLFGAIYGVAAGVLSIVFLWLCIRLYRRADRRSAALLFHYSLPIWRCSSARWRSTESCEPLPLGSRAHGPQARPQEPRHRPRGRIPVGDDLRPDVPRRQPLPAVVAYRPRKNGDHTEQIHLPARACCRCSWRSGSPWRCVGLILSWGFVIAGAAIVLFTTWRWIKAARDEYEQLPRER